MTIMFTGVNTIKSSFYIISKENNLTYDGEKDRDLRAIISTHINIDVEVIWKNITLIFKLKIET